MLFPHRAVTMSSTCTTPGDTSVCPKSVSAQHGANHSPQSCLPDSASVPPRSSPGVLPWFCVRLPLLLGHPSVPDPSPTFRLKIKPPLFGDLWTKLSKAAPFVALYPSPQITNEHHLSITQTFKIQRSA